MHLVNNLHVETVHFLNVMPAFGTAPVLQGAGFVLVPPTPADIPSLFEACTEAEAVASLNVPQPYTIADAEAYVRGAQAGEGGYFWTIREAVDAPMMGMIVLRFEALPNASNGCTPRSTPNGAAQSTADARPTSSDCDSTPTPAHAADIGGIYLLPPYRSKGLATRAARFLASWAFDNGFDILQWECLAANTSSVTVAERLGFVFYKDVWSSSQYDHHKGKLARLARMTRNQLRIEGGSGA